MLAPTRILRASWSSTLRLPKSAFPPRPLAASNAEYLRRCTDDLYAWQQSPERPTERFALHDGPPYANGPLHIGHALNKITKDIICRFQVGQGKKVSYIPGWDCHGLPIEIKALQAQKKDAAHTDAVSVREAARELATRTVEEQKRGFKEWAVMGDWDNAYKTMERGFEIRQLEVFKSMFEKGLIYRQNKPVYWSPSSRTALAEAELEYDEGHKSLAAFVRFPAHVSEELKSGALKGVEGEINVVIWTTTPWTLPANKAIAVHRDMEYCVVRDDEEAGELTLVAASRVAEYEKVLERKLDVVLSGLQGANLAGQLQYENPFQKANGLQPVIHADFVTDASGTGLVHMAPGHGMDDYNVCGALNIPAFAPVDDAGAFTKDAFPEQPELLEGLLVADVKKSGSNAVCNHLEKLGLLRGKQNYCHKYPIDWRTKQPVIIRATEQWFANVESIKDASMKAIANVKFIPETGRSRLESFIQGRSQWCISRQRAWGVPIPALYKVNGDELEATMNSEVIQHVIDVIKERGIDAWWTDAQDDPTWKPKHLTGTYVRGRDTMDVWFDSGTSWTLLPPQKDRPVADVYFEGTDQHRGWFQSSLLTHVATQPYATEPVKAPYKTLITHGFTMDSEGRKMSKSLGNVISPSQIMSGELLPPIKRKKQKGKNAKKEQTDTAGPAYDAMGSDALRLWAASSDYTRDVTIGQPVLHSVNQALHKYRVTFKWLLGIFSLPTCPPPFKSFNDLETEEPDPHDFYELTDRLAVYKLVQVSAKVHGHYAEYEFFKGVNTLNKFISNDLSAFYFETLKDRIYTGDKADCETLQRALGLVFYELLQMLAPITPLLVEEVWAHVPPALREHSVHPARAVWRPLNVPSYAAMAELEGTSQMLSDLNTAVKAAQERLRADKKIGSSLETAVTLYLAHSAAEEHFTCDFSSCLHPDTYSAGDIPSILSSVLVVSDVNLRMLAANSRSAVFPTEDPEDMKKRWAWCEEEVLQVGENSALQGARVLVHPPAKDKCPRCWRFVREEKEELCARCETVVGEEDAVLLEEGKEGM
ncbi:isoleucyl-tRNA synthetase-like protein [Cucurbitaria berberidis CBS 394.84]|uniref:Isoleucine--tRNA ligase, mitochondrial n=1 Tax=Cucurbitaria berberidis CBS 394.84 TaxID=1168544 RepID=A0A9P4L4N4_9PLEO|nr:isoleucyl-tRNA synthetase-like protein [Cucurbitaria berberidis CBS 394.84]KAF1841504.1 isoleucyl-tRNA synthetase-like protein [Cucurbitaria berberidis CBS 394.84]